MSYFAYNKTKEKLCSNTYALKFVVVEVVMNYNNHNSNESMKRRNINGNIRNKLQEKT